MPAPIILRDVVLSFPQLHEPKEFKAGDGRPRWSASFLIVKGSDNDKAIQAAIRAAATDVWKDKAEKTLKQCDGNSNKHCYLDGDDKDDERYAGHMVLSSHRQLKTKSGENTPPLIIDWDKSPLKPGEKHWPYGGCRVNAKVEIYCQAGENPGVRGSFSTIQFLRDGEPFGSGAPSADGLDEITEGADADELA